MKIGILLTNLGTPDSPTEPDLKRYLKEFLSDPRVIDPPNKLIWFLVLNLIILRKRPKQSAKNYAKIWDSFGMGSPLLNITQSQLDGVKAQLEKTNNNLEFEIGMRYGNPSISSALEKLYQKKCEKVVVLPLYPQKSGPTTRSTLDTVQAKFNTWETPPKLEFVEQYHQDGGYIQALANSITEHQKKFGKPDKLIMSYHGMPKRYVDNGDIYYQHCLETSKQLAKTLDLNDDDYIISFQSVFGKEEWIKPYTDATLKSLPKQGVKHVQVICPGFSADCLETIEEIDQENRAYFLNSGGREFSYIAALNDRDDHIQALSNIISRYL